MVSKKNKLQMSFWITLFVGVTFAYFMFLMWRKLTAIVGDSNQVLIITGAIVAIAIFTGYFSFDKVIKKFT